MDKLTIDILPAKLEGFEWLQVSAIRGGKVVGTATIYYLTVEGKTPELCNLFVRPSARRKGVAQAIVAAATKLVKRPVCLNVEQKSPAYWLYRKMGFTEIGPLKDKESFIWMTSPS
jgi:GNAT superfamily N-acetyltransferase